MQDTNFVSSILSHPMFDRGSNTARSFGAFEGNTTNRQHCQGHKQSSQLVHRVSYKDGHAFLHCRQPYHKSARNNLRRPSWCVKRRGARSRSVDSGCATRFGTSGRIGRSSRHCRANQSSRRASVVFRYAFMKHCRRWRAEIAVYQRPKHCLRLLLTHMFDG
jgi:hypothetical protein